MPDLPVGTQCGPGSDRPGPPPLAAVSSVSVMHGRHRRAWCSAAWLPCPAWTDGPASCTRPGRRGPFVSSPNDDDPRTSGPRVNRLALVSRHGSVAGSCPTLAVPPAPSGYHSRAPHWSIPDSRQSSFVVRRPGYPGAPKAPLPPSTVSGNACSSDATSTLRWATKRSSARRFIVGHMSWPNKKPAPVAATTRSVVHCHGRCVRSTAHERTRTRSDQSVTKRQRASRLYVL